MQVSNFDIYGTRRTATCALGCNLHRHRVSGYCRRHTAANYQYGHPNGRRITPQEYDGVSCEVIAFLDENVDHPAVRASVVWLEQWQDAAWSNGPQTVAAKPMQRLKEHGVIGLDILKAAASIWVYSQRNHKQLPDDNRLTYAISLAVLRLAPRDRITSPGAKQRTQYRRHTGCVRRQLGAHLRRHLAVFVVNLVDGLDRKEIERRQALSALHRPFVNRTALAIPTANTPSTK